MSRELTGCRVLLTGASSGIGKELAEQLAVAGARVVLAARSQAKLETLERSLTARGLDVAAVVTDVTLASDRRRAVDFVLQRWGGLDVLLNNAGVGSFGHFVDCTEEILRRVMEVNFFAPAELMRMSIPHLAKGRQPAIVNVASMCGRRGIPAWPEYSASKFALTGLSEALRAELVRFGIDVLLIQPGLTRSDLGSNLLRNTGRMPMRFDKGMPPASVARAIVKALVNGETETILGGEARWMLRLNRWTPWLLDRLIARKVRRLYADELATRVNNQRLEDHGMCGIAGLLNLTGTSPVPPGVLRKMAQAIAHRGPDEDGFFEGEGEGQGLGFASRRLSIVGLFDGRQPICNEDGQVTVVFNGELFDYAEVRANLQAKGHKFRTQCDTELLPHLWEDHGTDMLAKLRGQFAVALFDQRRRQVILARDRFGICPLFWTRRGDWLLFASEIKALIASGMVPVRPDPRGIHHVFTFFAVPGPVTCFEGIHCLLPGHYLSIRPGHGNEAGRIEDRIYWLVDFPDAGQEVEPKSRQQLAEDFEAVLSKAVERRLRADVPVVSYLSGGVDSSTVVALGTHLRKQSGGSPIPTFTIQVDEPGLDEVNEARQVANHLGARPVVVKFGHAEALASYPQLIRAAEAPVIDTSCAALLLLAREVHRQGYKVALTGEGADEWLAGYPWFKIHKAVQCLDMVPGLPVSSWIRQAYLKCAGIDFGACRWAERWPPSVGRTPGSRFTACLARQNSACSARKCGRCLAIICLMRTCSWTWSEPSAGRR